MEVEYSGSDKLISYCIGSTYSCTRKKSLLYLLPFGPSEKSKYSVLLVNFTGK